MSKFLIKRISVLIPALLGVTIAAFAFIRMLPGDPVLLIGGERGLSGERYNQIMTQYGFDKPVWQQYLIYLGNLFQGDLGKSIVTKQPVVDEFFSLFPATVEVSLVALFLAAAIGIPLGVIAAVKKGTAWDYGVMTFSLTGFSMPIFWWALLLIVLVSGMWGLTPVSGRISVMFYVEEVTGFLTIDSLLSDEEGAFLSALHHLILPSVVLATIPMASIARQTRSAMLESLQEDFVKTARSKGIPEWRVTYIHCLRNAMVPIVTVLGLSINVLFAGAVLTETIFSWPGIGKWMVDAIYRRDYPSVQGGLLLIACITIFMNLLVDLSYGLINPRIREMK